MENKKIELNRIYISKNVQKQPKIKSDKNHIKRPSWIKIKLNKKIIFIKILFNKEEFWYRRYFQDFFFPLDGSSEDTKSFYNEIAKNYENFVPHEKEIGIMIIKFFKELNLAKDSKILDIGAGTGIVTEELAKAGYWNLTLLDISKAELDIARNKSILKSAEFIESDLTEDKIEKKYNIIFETMALNEIEEEKMFKIFKKIKSSLIRGGFFVMIDRHLFPKLNNYFSEIKKGKKKIKTLEGFFNFYYYIGKA